VDPRTGVVCREVSLGKMRQRKRRDTDTPLREPSRDKTRKVRLSKIHGANSRPETRERAKKVKSKK